MSVSAELFESIREGHSDALTQLVDGNVNSDPEKQCSVALIDEGLAEERAEALDQISVASEEHGIVMA